MAFSLARKQFWEITAARFRYWDERRHEFNFSFDDTLYSLIRKYGAMTGESERQCQEMYDRYQGCTYEEFEAKVSRRRRYLWVKIDSSLSPAVSRIISAGTPHIKTYRYEKLLNGYIQATYRKVLHEMRLTETLVGHAVAADLNPGLTVSVLRRIELEELDHIARDILKDQSHLTILEDVEHYLNGHDTFDANFTVARKSPTAIAEDVLRRNPDEDSVPELIKIAKNGYRLTDSYQGSREQRAVYKALHSAFTRRLENE